MKPVRSIQQVAGRLFAILGVIALSTSAQLTFAQVNFTNGWYAGVSAQIGEKVTPTAELGYQFNPLVGVEAIYGELSSKQQATIPTYGVRVTGSYWLNDDFTLIARAGVATLKQTEKCLPVFSSCFSQFENSVVAKNFTEPTFGFGIQYELFEDVGLKLAFDQYKFGSNKDSVNETALSIVKRF